MPSLTPREQLFILVVLAAVLIGVAVKHWRDARREAQAAVSAHPLPTPAP